MILIVLGTERFVFDRFVKIVDSLVEDGFLTEEVFFQLGSSSCGPKHAGFKRFLPFDAMCENINKASLVLAHAGAGATLLSLQLGKIPILFPRLKKYGEHVDNHQVTFAEKIKEAGKALVAYNEKQLKEAIIQAKMHPLKPFLAHCDQLNNFLRDIA